MFPGKRWNFNMQKDLRLFLQNYLPRAKKGEQLDHSNYLSPWQVASPVCAPPELNNNFNWYKAVLFRLILKHTVLWIFFYCILTILLLSKQSTLLLFFSTMYDAWKQLKGSLAQESKIHRDFANKVGVPDSRHKRRTHGGFTFAIMVTLLAAKSVGCGFKTLSLHQRCQCHLQFAY